MPPVIEHDTENSVMTLQQQKSSFTRSLFELAQTLKRLTLANPSIPRSLSKPGGMKPEQRVTIHLMRHAEAEHNLAHLHGQNRADYKDPELTFRGLKQCQNVLTNFPYMDDISVVMCSPLRRTMQTALFSFQPLYARGLKVILWSALREWGNGASNIGSPVDQLEKEMADLPVDLRLLNKGWELETDLEEEGVERSNRVRNDLFALGDILLKGGLWKGLHMEKEPGAVHILVISHGGFLANVMRTDMGLYNAGYKSFYLTPKEQVNRLANACPNNGSSTFQ